VCAEGIIKGIKKIQMSCVCAEWIIEFEGIKTYECLCVCTELIIEYKGMKNCESSCVSIGVCGVRNRN